MGRDGYETTQIIKGVRESVMKTHNVTEQLCYQVLYLLDSRPQSVADILLDWAQAKTLRYDCFPLFLLSDPLDVEAATGYPSPALAETVLFYLHTAPIASVLNEEYSLLLPIMDALFYGLRISASSALAWNPQSLSYMLRHGVPYYLTLHYLDFLQNDSLAKLMILGHDNPFPSVPLAALRYLTLKTKQEQREECLDESETLFLEK